jgi:light-regulated signal transduction histidine kinase (bacteriophytochrome)
LRLNIQRGPNHETGTVVIWIGPSTDIHEQKETEQELRQANSDLEQFAYSASHDLREPLRSVIIYGQLLKKEYAAGLDARASQFLGRMENLLSDLLAYTQAARTDCRGPGIVNAEDVLPNVLTNLQRSITESRAKITHDPLPLVFVDEVHLEQLFQNLISNSIKYRRDHEAPLIHISVKRQGAALCFSIRDNGIGTAREFHSQVFGLFKRLHAKHSKYKGTGIGLAICQKIVERYGGRIMA